MEILLIIIFIISIILNIIFLFIKYKSNNKAKIDPKILLALINDHQKIISLIDYYENLAWNVIFSQYLMISFVDNITPDRKELKDTQKNYIKMVMAFIGDDLRGIIYIFFGSELNFLQYLIYRYELKFEKEIMERINKKSLEKRI